jgi:hypothetical protein
MQVSVSRRNTNCWPVEYLLVASESTVRRSLLSLDWLCISRLSPQISDVGCLALARAAKGALVLSRLNISLNHSTDATLHALAECLRFNTGTLKEVQGWWGLVSSTRYMQYPSDPHATLKQHQYSAEVNNAGRLVCRFPATGRTLRMFAYALGLHVRLICRWQ